MSASRIGRMQKAAVLVPLALLSTAWTVSVAGTGPEANVDAKSEDTPSAAPSEGPEVPAEAIEKPASVSKPDQAGEGNLHDALCKLASSDPARAAIAASA